MSQEIETLHKPFIRYLRGEKLPYIRARSDMRSTIALGAHDFTVLCGNACLCIEFKDKGDLSKDQKLWIASMESVGSKVFVIRDIAAAVELVQQWRSTLGEVPTKKHDTTVYGGRRWDVVSGTLINPRDL